MTGADEERTPIPATVVRRLPKYLLLTQRLAKDGQEWISSAEIGEALGLTSSTVRQDLSHVDFYGISKRGYSVRGLAAALSETLGANREIAVVVVGAGNMGRALVQHKEFLRQGFKICGIFDSDPALAGESVGDLKVRLIRELTEVICGQDVEIGVIAVPAPAAQEVADRLIVSGVRGILNVTSAHVVAPRHVPVVDVRIVASLQELTYAIKVGGRR